MITHLTGDCKQTLKTLPAESVHCCVTSPPYWGLRDYGVEGQIGLEESPEEYVENLVEVFREVRRVLRDDGTVWLNLGDSYSRTGVAPPRPDHSGSTLLGTRGHQAAARAAGAASHRQKIPAGLKPKDLVGIPWRAAFALQTDGWYLRSDIIWSKPNCMPESVRDRPTRSHEYIFLLSKSERYFYDAEAIRESATHSSILRWKQNVEAQEGSTRANGGGKTNGAMKAVGGPHRDKQRGHSRRHDGFNERWDNMSKEEQCAVGRNKRSVWTVAPACYSGAHFAVFPPDLIRPCILAGSPFGGTVLDPFGGSGTTALVAEQEGRNAILIELNPKYITLQKERTAQASLLAV